MTIARENSAEKKYLSHEQPSRSEYIITFLVILISVSWVADIGSNKIQYSLILLLGLVIGFMGRFKFRKNFVLLFGALFMGTLAIIMVQDGIYARSNQLTLINLLLAAVVAGAFRSRGRAFLETLMNILFLSVLVSISLYPFLIFSEELLVKIPSTLLDRTEFKASRDLYTLFGVSYFVSTTGLPDIWRNQSYFWEPGMFAALLIFALISSIVLGKPIWRKSTYIVGVISTFAIGGWVLLVLLLGAIRFRKISNSNTLFLTLLIIPLVVAYMNMEYIRQLVLFLFNRDIDIDSSVYIRSTDLWLPFVVATESPVWGHGEITTYSNAMRLVIDREMDGITNSLGTYFYRFGIPWGVFFCYIIARSLKSYSPNMTFGFPIILLILVYEPLGFSLFFFCFIFIGLNNEMIVDQSRLSTKNIFSDG